MATDGPVMRFNAVLDEHGVPDILYSASDERLMFSALMGGGDSAFAARSGRRPGPGLVASVSGPNVTVSPGAGVIYDSTYAGAGPYLFANAGVRTIALGARPGTGQSRIDLIVAQITDPDTVGGTPELKIKRVEGDASPTPSAPDLPPLSLEVARATVPAGSGAVSLTTTTARTVAAGGILPVATVAERDLLPSPHAGLAVYVEADDTMYVRGASAWKKYAAESSGGITVATRWAFYGNRPGEWISAGRRTRLFGSMYYDTTIPATGSVTLNGIPAPAYRWDGILRQGNNAVAAYLDTDRVLTWEGRVGTATGVHLALDGISYRNA